MKATLQNLLSSLRRRRVEYADARYVELEDETLAARNGTVEVNSRGTSRGVGVRVLWNGSWGFAATHDLENAGEAADRAFAVAQATASASAPRARLAEVAPARALWKTPFQTDPFKVPLDRKVALLSSLSADLKKGKRIRSGEASYSAYRTKKLFASTEGALIEQEIMECGAGIVAVAAGNGVVQSRSFPNSHRGDFVTGGWEHIEGMGLAANVERVREEAAALLDAPDLPDGKYDLILWGPQLALQIHESCGHPIELDRVLGTEQSLAGGSFLQPDKLGKFRYGSENVTISLDGTIPGGLGSYGFDDEGVPTARGPVIDCGVFVGYLTSRETAAKMKLKPNGAMRADSWSRLPLIRMMNISLEPGRWDTAELLDDSDGAILVDVNKSWSIDDRRLNFQFGCEAAWEIRGGKKTKMYRNPMYSGMTPQFWNSCDAVCAKPHWRVWGVPNCGKGVPGQTARVGHGAAPARFRGIQMGASR
ncbi:MAG: TldD/PmbA family protein [Planctomycetes bacterium]|nr:TldD/PmbA family protein [Planctomycetota bacterium]